MTTRPYVAIASVLVLLASAPADAQEPGGCAILCTPELSFEPTLTFSDLFTRARVMDLRDGSVYEVEPGTEFEMIFALGVPTAIPRVELTMEAIWAPFAETDSNPFTGYSSDDIGAQVSENPVELEFELNLNLLEGEQTGGWLSGHFDIIDKFSPAARPGDDAFYTHKLNLELDVALAAFNWLPEGNWLGDVEVEGSLDYLATGRPREGDEVPNGEERYLTDASPWSLSVLLVLPIAPL